MLEEQEFSTAQSLQLIQEMIGKAKRSYISRGFASIVWGALIILCSLVTWAQQQFKFTLGFDIWLLLLLALIPQIYFGIKERKSKDFVAHDEQTMTFLWTAFAICIFISSFYNGMYRPQSFSSLIMMLYGIPTFITGGICKFKPMILGGIICWVLSITSMFTPYTTDMLLMAACGLFAWLIPGIILWNRYKKQQAANV